MSSDDDVSEDTGLGATIKSMIPSWLAGPLTTELICVLAAGTSSGRGIGLGAGDGLVGEGQGRDALAEGGGGGEEERAGGRLGEGDSVTLGMG